MEAVRPPLDEQAAHHADRHAGCPVRPELRIVLEAEVAQCPHARQRDPIACARPRQVTEQVDRRRGLDPEQYSIVAMAVCVRRINTMPVLARQFASRATTAAIGERPLRARPRLLAPQARRSKRASAPASCGSRLRITHASVALPDAASMPPPMRTNHAICCTEMRRSGNSGFRYTHAAATNGKQVNSRIVHRPPPACRK